MRREASPQQPLSTQEGSGSEKGPEQSPISHFERAIASFLPDGVRGLHDIFNRGGRLLVSIDPRLALTADMSGPFPVELAIDYYNDESTEIAAWPVFARKDQAAVSRNPELSERLKLTYSELLDLIVAGSRGLLMNPSAPPVDSAGRDFEPSRPDKSTLLAIPVDEEDRVPPSRAAGVEVPTTADPARPTLSAVPVIEQRAAQRVPEILGDNPDRMMDAQRVETVFANGATVIGGSDRGIDYSKRNQDRIVIDPSRNEATVIDGMGGQGGPDDGEKAAAIIAQVMAGPGTVEERFINSRKALVAAVGRGEIDIEAGAPLSHVRMNPDNSADIWWLGDTRVMIIRADGSVEATEDQSFIQEALSGRITEAMWPALVSTYGFTLEQAPYPKTPDMALSNETRFIVSGYLSAAEGSDAIAHKKITNLKPGDRIVMVSDGLSDNFTPEEFAMLMSGRSVREAYDRIVAVSTNRMQRMSTDYATIERETRERKAGTRKAYSDGFRSMPKNDNRSLIIIEVPGATTHQLPPAPAESPMPQPPLNPEIIDRVKQIRQSFENKQLQEVYATLTPEELSQAAQIASWLNDGIEKYWQIHGVPIGSQRFGRLEGFKDYRMMPVEGVNQDVKAFDDYLNNVVSVYTRLNNSDLIGLPSREGATFENAVEVLLGPRKQYGKKIYRAVCIRVRMPGGANASQFSSIDGRASFQDHRFLLDASSPLFQWLVNTDNLRPLTFGLREAAMLRNATTENAQTGLYNRELVDGVFEPWSQPESKIQNPNRVAIIDLATPSGKNSGLYLHTVNAVMPSDPTRTTLVSKNLATSNAELLQAMKDNLVHFDRKGKSTVSGNGFEMDTQ